MRNTDSSLGCGKAKRKTDATSEPAIEPKTTNLNHAVLDPFLNSLKQGIYAGLVNEITRIGELAAKELSRNIKLMATKIAMEISNEVSVSSFHNTLTIKIELGEEDLQSIVSETLKNFKR